MKCLKSQTETRMKKSMEITAANQLSISRMNTALVTLLSIYLFYSTSLLSPHTEGSLIIGVRGSKNRAAADICTSISNSLNLTGAREEAARRREYFKEIRTSHRACKCDRNFQRIVADQDSHCDTPTSKHILLSDSQILDVLENKSVLFMGDSVIRQEECNLRCLLRDFFISSETRAYEKIIVELFHFQRGISISYLKIGLPWRPGGARAGVGALFQDVDIIYWNIGNHYSNKSDLALDLQLHWNIYSVSREQSLRPTILFRLQNPAHFQTIDGQFGSPPLISIQPKEKHPACQEDPSLSLSPSQSFRYQEGLFFALEHNMCYLDINPIANHGCYHPGHGECLHYDQDSWILSAINSAMLLKLSCGCQETAKSR